MYAHSNTSSSSSPLMSPPSTSMQMQMQHQLALITEFDSVLLQHDTSTLLIPQLISSSNSDSMSYNNSCSSYGGGSMQRSLSSAQLSHHHRPFSSLFAQLFHDSHDAPIRRVYSAGDLQQGINGIMQQNNAHGSDSPLSSESSMIIEGMSRACRYSPEEKKIRIQRYRTKRNQRNFNKKIKYACRKTLADSRPRIRGRFARNDEIDKNPQLLVHQRSHIDYQEEDEQEDENWVSIFDSLVAANLDQESQGSSSFGSLY